ncbi:MAG: CapA family protein [Clostridia bacterium]|nr:CapA family protein [Clostridia bacterium]
MEEQKKRKKRLTREQRLRIQRRRRRKKIIRLLLALTALIAAGIAIGLIAGNAARDRVASAPAITATPEPTAEPTATPQPTPSPTPEPTEVPEPKYITITAVGDCTLGGNTNDGGDGEERFQKSFNENGADYYLQNFRELFESDDLTIANLEGPLTDATSKRSGRTFNFRGEAEYAEILSGSGVDVCTLANNHAFDFKQQGFDDTAAALEAAGIGACGFGLEDYQIVNGVTIGNLGFTEWDFEESEIEAAVRAAKEKCDLLIVSIHWGEELEEKHDRTTEKLGKLIVDAGADLVIGNHSHIRGEIMKYNGKYIIYSLGNFCFGGNTRPTDMRCIVFQQSFIIQPDGAVRDNGINLIPARVSSNAKRNDLQPVYLEGDDAEEMLQEVYHLSDLTGEETIWMAESYVVQNNIVSANARIADSIS